MVDRAAAAKFDTLRRLFDLARSQRNALEQDQIERFAELLDERETLLRHLGALVEDAAAMPDNVIAFPGTPAAADEDALALETVLKGILELDRNNEALLQEKMTDIQRALPAITQGQRAAAGYRIDRTPSSFIDRIS